ncbi:squalene monooxygenase [Coprinopsis cinerea okayama7|uniref:Squalene monooxygenase n=1 Tax=Coprinopsis cinerea (strain Okayama-7 / 130 / ATCC MYA-4618 / FGSC 9003) TaxID=240176 RepID=A8PF05_COPC7|nr:squalene monooxygenase [Coprinopsis cinerea okayama7\|eukprot:XP_001840890.1 squalene monooxygenase [Coprinopsis cinerea okayama7\
MSSSEHFFDIVVVGAGVAGSAIAHALAQAKTSRTIALVERSFEEPERIVGELLQPGGVKALQRLGLSESLLGIDSVDVEGYLLIDGQESVRIPYPKGQYGRSFHHGRFIMALRRIALKNSNVTPFEATVSDLVECPTTSRITAVKACTKTSNGSKTTITISGRLIMVADGCFSNFRNVIMGVNACKPVTKSYFAGTILKNASLPCPKHGTVILPRGSGPVLLYQISQTDTRILIDIQYPLPVDLKNYILEDIIPQLPHDLQGPAREALSQNRIRRMPNSFLPPIQQGRSHSKPGVILLGDAWNMRHPLTGGGMTVALNDVVWLRDALGSLESLDDWEEIQVVLRRWHWKRKPYSSTINVIAGTLYGIFRKDDPIFLALREGCFQYLQRGEEYISAPIGVLSGLNPAPLLLMQLFLQVTGFSMRVLFTRHPRASPSDKTQTHVITRLPAFFEYPQLLLKACLMFWEAFAILIPVVWSELRWWAPYS